MTEVDDEATKALHGFVPFAAALGIEVIKSSPEEVRARVAWAEERCTDGGALNGRGLFKRARHLGLGGF